MNTELKLVTDQPETISQQIEKACHEWRSWKRAEELARESRASAEQKLVALAKFEKLEGSSTIKNGDYKISLTAKLDRKLDVDAYLAIENNLPENMRPIKTKVELDLKGLKWMEENASEQYAIVAPCITTKPAKTAVKVEFIGEL